MLITLSLGSSFAQQDVGISNILSPVSGCNVGSATKPINVIVRNYSATPIAPGNVIVRYRINAGPIFSQTITTFLAGNASFNFTFTQTQNLSACSQWNVKVWTSYATDPNHLNDTLNSVFTNDCTPVPGTFNGPSLVCFGNDYDSIQVIGGTYAYGLQWFSQVLPAAFLPTGVTNPKIYLNNLTNPTNYQVRYEGGLCPDIISSTFAIGISPALNTGTGSADLNLCSSSVSGSVSISGFTASINTWEQSVDGGATWTNAGSSANPYSIASYSDSTLFRALISSGACGSDYSDTIAVNIEPAIIPGTISSDTTVCESSNAGVLTLNGNANYLTQEWYTSTDNISFVPSGNISNTFNYSNLTQTTYYKVVYTCNLCPPDETAVTTVYVDPAINLGIASPNLTLCSDNVVGSVSLSGFASSLTQWQFSTNGGVSWSNTGSSANPYDISSISTTTWFRAIVESGVCGTDTSTAITVTVEPSIVTGTISGATTVCASANAGTLTLTGNANDFGYEWYSSTNNVTFTPTGNTSSTLNYTNLTQTTYYKVVLQGNICSDEETAVVIVTVDAPVNAGTVSPNLTLCETSVSGNISLSGFVSTISYWEQSTNGGASWSSTGSNANPYDISGISSTTLFRAVVQSGACGTATSATITVTVEPSIVTGTISGATTVCASANAGTLTLTGNANDFGYEWYSSTNNVTFTPTGNTSSTLNYTNLTQTTYYKVVLQGNICSDEETAVAIVTVDAPVNAGTVSPNLTLCETSISGNISLSGFVSTISYWEQSTNGGASWSSTGSNANPYDISGISSTTLFRAVVQSGACGTATSTTITATVEPSIVTGTISGATTVCASANAGTLTLIGNANDFGYEWYSSTNNVTFTPTGNTTSTLNYTNLTQTTYYKVVLQGNICSDEETAVVTVTVDAPVNAGTVSPNLTLCETSISGNISLSGFVSTISYWEQSTNGGASWSSSGSNANPYDISGISSTTLFRAVVQSGACGTATSATITATVEPSIVTGTITGATTVCASANAGTLTLTGNVNDFGYEWYSSTNNVTFTPTGNTSSTLNYTNLTQTTYYKVVLQGNICSDEETAVAIVTVDAPVNAGTVSPNLTLCETSISGNISLSGFVSTISYWEQSTNGGASWSSTGSNANPYDISGISSTTLFRAVVQSGACGTATSATITATVEPSIVTGTISGATTVCASANAGTLTLTGNANDFGYEWYSSTNNVTFTPTGNTSSTLNYTNLTQTTYYKVVLQGDICVDEETSVAAVTVDPALNLGTSSVDLQLCSNNISGSVTLTGAVSLFDWEQSNDNGITWNSTGVSTSSLNISYLSSSALFRALVISGACGSGYSDTISVTIEPSIVIGTVSGSATVCSGANSGNLTLTGNANDQGIEWYSSLDGTNFTGTGITTNSYSYSNLTQTTYFKVILSGNFCSDEETSVLTITVDQPLNLGTVSSDLVLCANDITGTISVTGAVNLVEWEQSNDNGVTWISTGVSTSSLNISYLINSAWFRAEIASGVCGSGYSDTITVDIIAPLIAGTISGATSVCVSGNIGDLTLTGNANQTSLMWFSSTDNVNFTATGVTSTIYSYLNLTQTTFFKVIAYGNPCTPVETPVVVVAVDPLLNLGVASGDLNICSSNIAGTISVTGAVNLTNWIQSNDGGSSWVPMGNSNSSIDISFLSNSALFRAVVSSGACGSGLSDTIAVTIHPAGTPAFITSDFVSCIGSGETDSIMVLNYQGSILTWQTSINNGLTWVNNGSTNTTLYISNLLTNTQYQLVTTHPGCPNVTSNVVTGTLAPLPSVAAGDDITINLGSSDQLTGSGGLFGIWTPSIYLSNQNLATPLCTPLESTTYAYTVIDINGCTNTDYVNVMVDTTSKPNEEEGVIVYNIITPNGDGINDVLVIEGLEIYSNNKLLIFNGNGNLIYEQEEYQNDWDGTHNGALLPDGVYLYAIEVSRLTKHRGFITLMRDE